MESLEYRGIGRARHPTNAVLIEKSPWLAQNIGPGKLGDTTGWVRSMLANCACST